MSISPRRFDRERIQAGCLELLLLGALISFTERFTRLTTQQSRFLPRQCRLDLPWSLLHRIVGTPI
jgi:hypothetical protein